MAIAEYAPRSKWKSHQFRDQRRRARNRRLHRQVRNYVMAHDGITYVGVNRQIEQLAIDVDFERHEFVCAEAKFPRGVVTLICVSHGTWTTPAGRRRLFDLQLLLDALGYDALIFSQALVDGLPALRARADTTESA